MRHSVILAVILAALVVVSACGPTTRGITHIIMRGGQAAINAGNYGPCIRTGGLANTPLGDKNIPSATGNNQIGIRFIPGHTGMLSAFRTLSATRQPLPPGNPGSNYGQGTGGTIQVQLQTDDGTANHFPSGRVLGSYMTAADAGMASFDPHFSGGDLPKITLASPVSISAGSIYHLVFKNVMPSLSTTVAAAVTSTGVHAVTPASMAGIAISLLPSAITTVAAAVIATGSRAVIPASMIPGNFTNIVVGSLLSIGTGVSQEYVVVTAVTATTFTANFTKTHAAGFSVTVANGKVLSIDTGAKQEFVVVTNVTATRFTANFKKTHAAGFAVTSDVTMNFISLDNTYNAPLQTPIQPCVSDLALAVNYNIDNGGWQIARSIYAVTNPIHDRTPPLALYYGDGFSEGKLFSGGSDVTGAQDNPVSGAKWTRDQFTPTNTIRIAQLSINLQRSVGNDPITVTLIDDAASTTLLTLTFTAASFSTSNNTYVTSAPFAPITLTAGRLYDLRLTCPGTSTYYASNQVQPFNYASFPFGTDPTTYFSDAQGVQVSTNSGGSWGPYAGSSIYTLQWYVAKTY